ncbi:hypothetical protein IKF89_02135 [Candidatus Saccharibacteria bacterium]|nr:hypothetical protein [Candidatus Saccharibacteria bacterium]
MNKDVIYIEPEDDITDIIAKIEKSKEKIVALVPPKKAGVFRSLVNIKLISKAGAGAEKSVVLVTTDPSIVKLAAATKLPVSKNLQSAPVIPEAETAEAAGEQTIEDVEEPEENEKASASESSADDSKTESKSKSHEAEEEEEPEDEEEEDDEEDEKPAKKEKKPAKSGGNKLLNWIKAHKKLTIAGAICAVGIIGFLIWAFGFAPAADITVAIKTDSKNFSEGITFVDSLSSEDAKEGKFYLEQKKIENTQEVNFEATGQKNQGDKATGDVVIYGYFDAKGVIAVNAGSVFTVNNLSFVSNSDASLSWDGKPSSCENSNDEVTDGHFQCLISGRVGVTAMNGGSNYNIPATPSGWSTTANVRVYSDKSMAGGTDKTVTVVQQSDIEKAKSELTTANEEENKKKLYESIGDEYYIIETSFEQSTSNAEATPAADQEVTDGKKPVLKATTTATVYVINEDKLKDFIKAKADLSDGQKVYDVKDIYIENFTQKDNGGSAKLKAQYYVGPKITETEVVDKVKGKGLGDAQREIRDLYGVSNVTIDTSYPWVMTIPGDSNKVTVKFEVKDQDGNEVKEQSDDNKNDDSEKNDSEKKSDEKQKN